MVATSLGLQDDRELNGFSRHPIKKMVTTKVEREEVENKRRKILEEETTENRRVILFQTKINASMWVLKIRTKFSKREHVNHVCKSFKREAKKAAAIKLDKEKNRLNKYI